VEGRDAEALQVFLLDVFPHDVLVNNSHADVEGLRPQLELEVQLREPIDQVGTHLLGNLALVCYQEILGVHVFNLFAVKEAIDIGSIFGDALWVADVKEVANLEVASQGLHPLLPALFNNTGYLLSTSLGDCACLNRIIFSSINA
jgi:hypothetical protein